MHIIVASLKRVSPIVHQHRSAKMHHYDMHDNIQTMPSGSKTLELMSPEINSMTADDRTSHHARHRNDDGRLTI